MPRQSWSERIEARLIALRAEGQSLPEILETLVREFPEETFSKSKVKSKLQRLRNRKEVPLQEPLTVSEKVEIHRTQKTAREVKRENRELLEELSQREKELEAILAIKQTPQEYLIYPQGSKGLSATAVICWSDWHIEELVNGATVNYLNEFNLEIADARIQRCIENSGRLLDIASVETQIDKVILWLGGDFITGNIHEELLENTSLRPIEAITWVQRRLKAGIEYLLERTDKDILIVCNGGNHARITKTTHFATEAGNSLEYVMYHFLKDLFSTNERVEWLVSEGYHAYVNLYGKSLRFHHGHAVKYGGGVGGIFIPAYKAVSQWNKAKHADLDIFGHFHQLKNGGNFICNGSLIGYNAYALSIKADFEKPRQKFFMYASSGEVIGEHPIFLD